MTTIYDFGQTDSDESCCPRAKKAMLLNVFGIVLGSKYCYIWKFNFHDFNLARDIYTPDSIAILQRQGINFAYNATYGIHSAYFGHFMISCGLLYNYCEEDIAPDLGTVLMKTPISQKEERRKTYKDYRRQSFKEIETNS
ncbi:hypothetical protein Lal_00022843 [Lupinus albus]|nr:hypothetical protein Lal_00022843 [Lupinus albus]